MQSLGLTNDEIAKFADASYWLDYFPPLAVKDLQSIGIHVCYTLACFADNILLIVFFRLIGGEHL